MAPVAVEAFQNGNGVAHHTKTAQNGTKANLDNGAKVQLESNGSLNIYEFKDLTPCIGREFPTANLVDMMNAPNAKELLTELALTSKYISQIIIAQ